MYCIPNMDITPVFIVLSGFNSLLYYRKIVYIVRLDVDLTNNDACLIT